MRVCYHPLMHAGEGVVDSRWQEAGMDKWLIGFAFVRAKVL